MRGRWAPWQTKSVAGKTRKRWLIAAGFVLVVLGATVVVVFLLYRDKATPVGQEDVAGTLVTGDGRPGDYGLYAYTTTGFETTDAFAGSRHDYPAETYLTIQPGGCGTLVRWQPLEERWDEWDYCADATLAGWLSFHKWFGVPNHEDWTCTPPLPTRAEPGALWSGDCEHAEGANAAGVVETQYYEVVGFETLTVGGEPAETIHIRNTSEGNSASTAADSSDTWILAGTLLIVRQVTADNSVTPTPIGPVTYHEEYQIDLVSLYPAG